MEKLTENATVELLEKYLRGNGWVVECCFDQEHGNDIVATKDNQTLIVEVKGAKAGDKSPTKKREYFNSGQIKIHFGAALVKILNEKSKNPKFAFAIAHPDDADIRKNIEHLIQYLKPLDIKHYWISENGTVIEE